MHWAMFGHREKQGRWVFCGFTEHEERASEFEESALVDPNGLYDAIVIVPLEDCMITRSDYQDETAVDQPNFAPTHSIISAMQDDESRNDWLKD